MRRQINKTLLALLVMLMSSVGAWAQESNKVQVGTNYYPTLAAALEYVSSQNSDEYTITLLDNYDLDESASYKDMGTKNYTITIDLNGKSVKYQSLGLYDNLTIKNGTWTGQSISNVNGGNNGTLTLNNATVTCTENLQWMANDVKLINSTLILNSGTVTSAAFNAGGDDWTLTMDEASKIIMTDCSVSSWGNIHTARILAQLNQYALIGTSVHVDETETTNTIELRGSWGLLLTNNLSNATVDFWVSASEPTSTTVFADEDKTNLAEPGEYVVMHIVPSDGYWTNQDLLFSMETGALLAPQMRAPGLDLGRIPTLLKADEGYYNGAGWYYYQIPAAHTTDSYKTSTVDGFVVPTFDLRNATASVDGKTLTVASGDWNTTISIDENSFTYNGSAQGPLLSGTTMQIKKGTDDACTLPLSGNVTLSSTATNAGNHNATLSAATNGCFTNNKTIPFSIGKKDLTVTANNHSIVFGSAAANNGVSYNGFENNETAAVLGGTLAYAYNTANDNTGTPYTAGTSGVGTYYIIPSGLTSNNYNIAYATGTLTINAKRVNDSSVADEQDSKITILTTDIPTAGYVYDGTAKTPTVQVKDGDNVISPDEYTVSYSNNINAGTTATVTITNKAGGNYNVSGSKTFSIAQKTLTITANDQEKATGSDDPTLTYTQDGLVAGDAITGALTRVAGEAVGSYAISQGTLSAGNNYTINFTGATLTIYRDLKMAEMFSGTNEWASMIALEDLAVPAGVAAYIVTGVSGNTVITKEISYIPAGVPIILQKKDNNASGKATAGTGTDDVSENLLKGSATEASTIQPYKDYVLYNGRFELAGVSSVPAGKVYLPATALSGTAAPGFLTIGDETTSLSSVPSPSRDGGSQAWYTIDGRKLDKAPKTKGIYVNGGRKVVIK